MFTFDDIDVRGAGALLEALAASSPHPTPEADARLHPADYFIVGA